MEYFDDIDFNELLDVEIENLKSFSPAVPKIIKLINDLNSSANDIMKVIKTDQVLAGNILKIVNSAYYGLADKVTNLNQALVYLGLNTVKNIALSSAVSEIYSSKHKSYANELNYLWEHSLKVAVIAKRVAATINVDKKDIEEFFITGLLHDLGKIPLLLILKNEYHLKFSRNEEIEKFTISHDDVGFMILKKWDFPQSIIDGVRFHHIEGEKLLSNVIYLADSIAHDNLPNTDLMSKIKITNTQIEEIKKVIEEDVNKVKEFLKV